MKKTTKKNPSKAKKAVKDLAVKPAKGGAVRGGKGFTYGGLEVTYTQQKP